MIACVVRVPFLKPRCWVNPLVTWLEWPIVTKEIEVRFLSDSKAFYYAPNFEKVGDMLVSACPCVCMCGASRYRLETSCMDSSWKNRDTKFWFSLNYLPLLNYGLLTNKGMKFCKCRISKSIIARNLKLVLAGRG